MSGWLPLRALVGKTERAAAPAVVRADAWVSPSYAAVRDVVRAHPSGDMGSEGDMPFIFRIEHGVVHAHAPDAELPLVRGSGTLAAGTWRGMDADGVLRRLAAAQARMVPWARVFVGAKGRNIHGNGISGSAHARHGFGLDRVNAGQSPVRDTILLSANCEGSMVMQVFHHEAWHILEPHVPAEFLDALDVQTDESPLLLGSYTAQPAERRAELFERAAVMFDSGMAPPPCREASPWNMWRKAWDGTVAQVVLKREPARMLGSFENDLHVTAMGRAA